MTITKQTLTHLRGLLDAVESVKNQIKLYAFTSAGMDMDASKLHALWAGELESGVVAAKNHMKALMDRVEELEAMTRWRPIETAPRDGTPILVWGADISNPTGGYYPRSCWWSQEGHEVWVVREDASNATYLEPDAITHWMPLPTPPAQEADHD